MTISQSALEKAETLDVSSLTRPALIWRWYYVVISMMGGQTASGQAKAEMNIEGILQIEELRDYLYNRMRGARGEEIAGADNAVNPSNVSAEQDGGLQLLKEIRDSLKTIADHLTKQSRQGIVNALFSS